LKGGKQRKSSLKTLWRKKVNFKWHVNVMRSHVKWYFLFTDTQHWTEEQMKENGKRCDDYQSTLISCEFITSLFISPHFCTLATFRSNHKIKIFNIFVFIAEIPEVKHAIALSKFELNSAKLNSSTCIIRLRITLISYLFSFLYTNWLNTRRKHAVKDQRESKFVKCLVVIDKIYQIIETIFFLYFHPQIQIT
jgi:hypothetical protein